MSFLQFVLSISGEKRNPSVLFSQPIKWMNLITCYSQAILDDAVKQLGKVTQDKTQYSQVVKGLITQVSLASSNIWY